MIDLLNSEAEVGGYGKNEESKQSPFKNSRVKANIKLPPISFEQPKKFFNEEDDMLEELEDAWLNVSKKEEKIPR